MRDFLQSRTDSLIRIQIPMRSEATHEVEHLNTWRMSESSSHWRTARLPSDYTVGSWGRRSSIRVRHVRHLRRRAEKRSK